MKEIMGNKLTMSSLEISKLTGKRHDNVMADCQKMIDELKINAPEISGTYKTSQGNEYQLFNLNKELTFTLISGYSIKLRHTITKRWLELEQAQSQYFIKDESWHQIRVEGKLARRELTDIIKVFIAYAYAQDSKAAHRYYQNATKSIYTVLFEIGEESNWQNARERLDHVQLSSLKLAEIAFGRGLEDGMRMQLYYKDVYQIGVQRVGLITQAVGKSKLIQLKEQEKRAISHSLN